MPPRRRESTAPSASNRNGRTGSARRRGARPPRRDRLRGPTPEGERLVIELAGLYPPTFRVRVSAGRIKRGNPDPGCFVYKPNNLTGHQALIVLVMFSAPPALMATFTASSI